MTPLNEQWAAVPGFEGLYEVSTLGRVRSVERTKRIRNRWGQEKEMAVPGRILAARLNHAGYLRVNLSKAGKHHVAMVHRLVCLAFLGEAEGMEAAHNDGNPLNNAIGNLRWASAADNQRDRVRHLTDSRGERNGRAKITEEMAQTIRGLPGSHRKIAAEFGISPTHVLNIRHGRNW